MPTETLASLFVQIILMVLLGFVLKKCGMIDKRLQSGLSELLMSAVLPFSVLSSANSEFSPQLAGRLGISAAISIAYYAVALLLALGAARLAFARKPEEVVDRRKGLFVNLSVFANTGFIGLPLVGALYGSEGMLYGVIYNLAYQLFLFTIGVQLLSGEKKMQWRAVLLDPATLASIAAVVIYVSPFRFPTMLNDTFEQIGNMCVPLSMIIIGCCLADIRPEALVKERMGFAVCALRLAAFPLLMLLALRALNIGGVLAASCAVLTGLPIGSLNVILAERYHKDAGFATCSVCQSMVLFVGTLPLLLLSCGWLIP